MWGICLCGGPPASWGPLGPTASLTSSATPPGSRYSVALDEMGPGGGGGSLKLSQTRIFLLLKVHIADYLSLTKIHL